MNVKINKLILEIPEIKELFIYPSCGDETNAMGAAYYISAQKNRSLKDQSAQRSLLGTEFSDSEVEEALRKFKFRSPVCFRRIENIEQKIAQRLAEGIS